MESADLQQVIRMQGVCDRVIGQAEALGAVVEAIASLNRDIRELEAFYQGDWLRLHDAPAPEGEARAALLGSIAPGNYSILSQDTIWDALQNARRVQLALLKRLAAAL